MDYNVSDDIKSVLELRGITIQELADELEVTRATVSSWINKKHPISAKHLETFYNYTYKRNIYLNKIKEQFYKEELDKNKEVLLFHGSKTFIEGKLKINKSKKNNDFGNGFYCGESLDQSAMFVATYTNPSLYIVKFKPNKLKYKKYSVDNKWMLTVAYNRGKLEEYKNHKIIKDIEKEIKEVDYIIAPIADNRMYEIIDSFINGEITDIQCQHCLSATNLGMQYVFINEKSLSNVELLEKCYLTKLEKEDYLISKQNNNKVSMDKVKLARKQFRNKGKYIEEILR